jgi:hypothetical protein
LSGSGFKPNCKKIHPFGFSPSAEAYRIFAFFYLAKAALEIPHPRPKGHGNLNSRRRSFDTLARVFMLSIATRTGVETNLQWR